MHYNVSPVFMCNVDEYPEYMFPVKVIAHMTESEQCGISAARGYQLFGLIMRNISMMKRLKRCHTLLRKTFHMHTG